MPDSKDSYKTNLKIQKWKKEGRGQGFGVNGFVAQRFEMQSAPN